jgi:hypothetical protein
MGRTAHTVRVRAPDDEAPFVSTGALPPSEVVGALVTEAYQRYRDHDEGAPSDVYPVLARVPAGLFGLCVAGTNGVGHPGGDRAGHAPANSPYEGLPAMLTIQLIPNLSTHIPKLSPHGAFSSGTVTVPPCDSFSQ